MEGFLPISIYGAQNTKTKDLPSANISDQQALLRSVPRDILLKGRIWVFFFYLYIKKADSTFFVQISPKFTAIFTLSQIENKSAVQGIPRLDSVTSRSYKCKSISPPVLSWTECTTVQTLEAVLHGSSIDQFAQKSFNTYYKATDS